MHLELETLGLDFIGKRLPEIVLCPWKKSRTTSKAF